MGDLSQEKQNPLLPDVVEAKQVVDFEHSQAQAVFEHALRDLPFADVYAAMIAQGFKWREAAYVGWSSMPKKSRVPKTFTDFAELLDCSKGKLTRMGNDKRLTAMRLKFALAMYHDALPDIVDASIEVASKPTYKATPERNAIMKMIGMNPDVIKVQTGEAKKDLSELSDEELAAMLQDEQADDDE